MRTNFNFDSMGIFGVIFGFGGLAFAAWQAKKMDDILKKVDSTIDDIDKKTPVEVQEAVVNKAIERAVDRKVRDTISDVADQVRKDIQKEVNTQVRKDVDANFQTIKEEVASKISDQVAAIDEYALQETVKKQAEQKILKKFDGSLDGVLGDFKHQLGNVQRVWESVADAMAPRGNNSRGMTFRIGD